MVKDYYKVMELTNEATADEVKKAYRRLAMKYHPDRNQNNPDCEERLKEVNEAYQILGDGEKRRLYDFLYQRASEDPLTYDWQNLTGDFITEVWTLYGKFFNAERRGGCKNRGFGMRGCGMWKRYRQ